MRFPKRTRSFQDSKLVRLLLSFVLVASCVTLFSVERKIFTFSADSTSANLAEGKEFTLLRGDAKVTADDVLIEAGEIKLYGDDFQFAEVDDNFKAVDLKNDFSLEGDKLFYDRKLKLLRAEGNVIMRDNKNDLVLRARFLESKEDGKFMITQLGVTITKKKELSARSEFLTYYRDTEILDLTGFPYALWNDDEYSADRVSINLNTDEVLLDGGVRGTISTKVKEKEPSVEPPVEPPVSTEAAAGAVEPPVSAPVSTEPQAGVDAGAGSVEPAPAVEPSVGAGAEPVTEGPQKEVENASSP